MEEEKLLLPQRDRDRLKVLHEVQKGHLTQRQASQQLKLTNRWIRKLLLRMEKHGDRAVIMVYAGGPRRAGFTRGWRSERWSWCGASTPISGRR
jgi:hypothetical protein